jgi:AraC-like DNA-binding protein
MSNLVSVLAVRTLAHEFARSSVDRRALLERCGLSEHHLADLRYAIPQAQFAAALAQAARLTQEPALGLRAAEMPPERTLQILAHLAAASPTLSTAISTFDHYAKLLGDGFSAALVPAGDELRLLLAAPMPTAEARRYFAELLVGGWVTICRRNGPALEVVGVGFAHPCPSYGARYASVFRCPPRFSEEHCYVALRGSAGAPQPFADAALREALCAAAERLLVRELVLASVGERVRAVLGCERNLCDFGTAGVARVLGITERTLRRRLAEETLSMSALLDEARSERARERLRAQHAIKEVADDLGYSEPSAFHRAFRRWTGQTPASYLRAYAASEQRNN